MGKEIITKVGGKSLRIFSGIFKLRLVFFFLLFILINSITIGIQQGSIEPVIKDIGSRFLTPTLKIQQFSLEIISRGGIYKPTPHFWGGVWNFIMDIWSLLTQFYIILLWLKILALLVGISPLSDKSRAFVNWTLAILIFIVFQMLYIATINKGSILVPLLAFKDFARAFPYIIGPLSNIGEVVVGNSNQANMTNVTNLGAYEVFLMLMPKRPVF